MKLLQFYHPESGKRAGVLKDGMIYDISKVDDKLNSVLDVLKISTQSERTFSELIDKILKNSPVYKYNEIDKPFGSEGGYLLIPIDAQEVWGFGVTYKRSADARDKEAAELDGIYGMVYSSERPECFFKATLSRCVGPNDYIGIRSDSVKTASEPELAYVVSDDRKIIGYTICNDVSAWDIEKENPLYLPQSKTYSRCCAIGPVITTVDEIENPYNLKITCRIVRYDKLIFEKNVNTSLISRKFEVLNECLFRNNPIPFGTVVTTGTGLIIPDEFIHCNGDRVEIEIEGIGKLCNLVKKL